LAGPWVLVQLFLGRLDVCRFRAFLALAEVIFDRLALCQRPETLGRNLGVMYKHIRAAVVGNYKTKTFFSLNHFTLPVATSVSLDLAARTAGFLVVYLKRLFEDC